MLDDLRSLTWGVELNQEQDGCDMMLFPKENAVMTVYGGRPHLEGIACRA
jgi:hypothetical protein